MEGHEVQTTDGRKSNKARLIYHLCVKFIYYWGRAYRKTSRELSISIATAVKDMSSSSARATKGSSPVASIKEASAEAATGSVAAEPTGAPLTLAKTERRLFSAHHPMIPKRYVPAWQLDMKNRKLIIQNCYASENSSWVGHVSYFWEGRERLSATRTNVYSSVIGYTRSFHGNSSPFSKFNSTLVAMSS